MLRVGLNALALTVPGSGVQTYIRNLMAAIPQVDADIGLTARVQRHAAAAALSAAGRVVRPDCAGIRRLWESSRSFPGTQDIIHGLDVDLPLRRTAPLVATVHDLSAFDVPWAFQRHRAAAERALIAATVRRADALIAVSRFTAERLLDRFGREAEVTRLAPAPEFAPPTEEEVERARQAFELPERFVLHVGTVEPRKDLVMLATVCANLTIPLVLAGRLGRVQPSPAICLGRVPADALPGLYKAASVVAYPSRYEGFGLPPLEAMATGAPVVATAVGALPELFPVADGFLVPIGDACALSEAIRNVTMDADFRSHVLAVQGDGIAHLNWRLCAEQTVEVYRRLV